MQDHRPRSRDLIVNADDYGLTEGISEGILRAHTDGIVTSTSVIALGPAFDRTIGSLAAQPGLGVGIHLALTGEDPPLADPAAIPTLVDASGRMAPSWRALARRLVLGQVDPDDVRRELKAQHQRLAGAGVEIDHVDAHQHVHLWPSIRDVVIDLAREWEVPLVRVPEAGAWSPIRLAVNPLGRRLARAVDRAGLTRVDGFAGFDDRGTMGRDAVARALHRLADRPGDAFELGTHPGEAVDAERHRYRWGYEWSEELAALTDRGIRDLVDDLGFRLVAPKDLVPASRRA